jgi:hypothetical protein
MLAFTSVYSKAAHGGRYHAPKGFEGEMRKKTRDQVTGAILGMLKGQSIKANWTDYRFVLKPGATAKEDAVLEYYELHPESVTGLEQVAAAWGGFAAPGGFGSPSKQAAEEAPPPSPSGTPRAAHGAGSDGATEAPAEEVPLPKGRLFLNYRSKIEENGKSAGHELHKFSVSGRHADGERVEWDLKVAKDEDYRQWLASLKALCKGRWQDNAKDCAICVQTFSLFKHSHHCRSCGRCVCDPCSQGSRALPGEGILPVRVCDPCMKELGPGDGVLGS